MDKIYLRFTGAERPCIQGDAELEKIDFSDGKWHEVDARFRDQFDPSKGWETSDTQPADSVPGN